MRRSELLTQANGGLSDAAGSGHVWVRSRCRKVAVIPRPTLHPMKKTGQVLVGIRANEEAPVFSPFTGLCQEF